MTQVQIQMLESAIQTHQSSLYRDAEAYKRQNNTEAVKDCLAEIKKFEDLKKSLKSIPVEK